jgi:histidinol phosphatase-like enzyme (inositol monophosphatase family)
MSPNEIDVLAAFACELADAARAVTLVGAGAAVLSEDKNVGGAFDPVTEADREAERAIRDLIEARFPEHGIVGEEFGEKKGQGTYSWSLDPIDGTRAFVCGLPSWTTLIALLVDGAPVIGLIDAPALGECFLCHGQSGRLIRIGGSSVLKASACAALSEARLATTDPYLFAGEEAAAFDRLRRAVRLTRYGFDAYAYARLAAGTIDLVAESGLKPHDYNALVPVVRSAGGVIGNWRGEDDFAQGQVLAAATPRLFEAAVAALAH